MVRLDFIDGIELDDSNPPVANYQALRASFVGIHALANLVREAENHYIGNDEHAHLTTHLLMSNAPPILPSAFNWFSLSLVNYLRLVALIQKMTAEGWTLQDLSTDANRRKTVSAHCRDYVKNVVPEIYTWRNKVAAHFAATDPYESDNLGTLAQSVMGMVEWMSSRYYVGSVSFGTGGQLSTLPKWSVTETFEALAPRLWPDASLPPQIAPGALKRP